MSAHAARHFIARALAALLVLAATPAASCTESALDAALAQLYPGVNFPGGNLTFDCGPDAVVIPVTTEKQIGLGAGTNIDGAGRVTLDGGGTSRLFVITGAESRVELRGLVLTRGHAASAFGGALYLGAGVALLLERVTVRDSHADFSGGAIFTEAGSGVALTSSSLLGNDADFGGAVAANGDVTLTDSLVANNTAVGEGGGLQVYSALTTLLRTRFEDNAAADGGAILQRGGMLRATSSAFTDNSASGRGGAAATSLSAATVFDDCVFERNIAQRGGAISRDSSASGDRSEVTVYFGRLEANQAVDGGAIHSSGTTFSQSSRGLITDGVLFHANTADRGGAIFSDGILRLLGGTRVDANSARRGGGVFVTSTAAGDGVVFTANVASEAGGGMLVENGASVLANARFEGNRAAQGGALALQDSFGSVQTGAFIGNSASGAGGALYAAAALGGRFDITNVTFSFNQAAGGNGLGGDAYAQAASGREYMLVLNYATLIDGSAFAGSSLHAAVGGRISLQNSVLWPLVGSACATTGNGSITSAGGNVGTAFTCPFAAPLDRTVTSFAALGLAPLADNGGLFRSYLPDPDSAVLERVVCGGEVPLDVRGRPRPVDANGDGAVLCDAGAVERQLQETPASGALFHDGFESFGGME